MFGKLFKAFLDILRSKDWLTARIWRFKIHRKLIPVTWDLTSYCLKKAFDSELPRKSFRFLDMGSGQVGLLGHYVKSHWSSAEVWCVDIYPEFVENIKFNAKRNCLDIVCIKSDLFSDVTGKFNVIAFNPPYVPDSEGLHLDYPHIRYGGGDGAETTRRFLALAKGHLEPGGRVFLGINCFYLPETLCKRLIDEHRYDLEKTIKRSIFNTARVFILKPKPQAS